QVDTPSRDCFATPGRAASYAGLAPVIWRSGTSISSDNFVPKMATRLVCGPVLPSIHLVEGHGSGVPDLLRYEAGRRNEAQQGSDRSCTAAWQRADRDAARRNPL